MSPAVRKELRFKVPLPDNIRRLVKNFSMYLLGVVIVVKNLLKPPHYSNLRCLPMLNITYQIAAIWTKCMYVLYISIFCTKLNHLIADLYSKGWAISSNFTLNILPKIF